MRNWLKDVYYEFHNEKSYLIAKKLLKSRINQKKS